MICGLSVKTFFLNYFCYLKLLPRTMGSNSDSGVIAAVGQSLSRVQLFVTPRTARLPFLHYLPEFAQIYVYLSLWCHPTISFSIALFSCLQSFPEWRSLPMSQIFALGGQSIGASASASVFPMNIQGWLPLGLTGLVSLLSKGLSGLLQHHNSKASIH